jgi:hypothetical protein
VLEQDIDVRSAGMTLYMRLSVQIQIAC